MNKIVTARPWPKEQKTACNDFVNFFRQIAATFGTFVNKLNENSKLDSGNSKLQLEVFNLRTTSLEVHLLGQELVQL